MSACEAKIGFTEQARAERSRDQHGLDPVKYLVYQCELCKLWHVGRDPYGARPSKHQRRARARRQVNRTAMGQALHAAGWQHSSERTN